MKTIENLLLKSNYSDKTFTGEFNEIILSKVSDYGKNKAALKSFFEDLQHGGCVSGMIGDFIYHSDCKEFYIKHIDDLEEMREDLEEMIGERIDNRHSAPHYTFICWLCFEEYCFDLYREIFEN